MTTNTKKKKKPQQLSALTNSLDDLNRMCPADQDVSLKKAIYASNVRGNNHQIININTLDAELQQIMRKLEEISNNVLYLNQEVKK